MNYLVDSCVIIDDLNEATNIINVNDKIKDDKMAISNVILDELKRPINAEFEDKKLDTLINSMIKYRIINFIDINQNPKIKQRLQDIRNSHYRWITDPTYLERLIQEGIINRNEIKCLRYKDLGECSLIAIALENVKDYIILTNDKGKIYTRPYENLFKYYPTVKVMNYKEFSEYIKQSDLEELSTV